MNERTEYYAKKIKEKAGYDEFTFLEEVIDSKTNIKVRHEKCGFEFYTNPCRLVRTMACAKCAKKIKMTADAFKEKLKELGNDEYELISEFKNMSTKVKLLHKKCGNEFEIFPTRFVNNNSRCIYCCYGDKNRRTTEMYKKEVQEKFNGKYTILGEYVNNRQPVETKCDCGHIWKIRPRDLVQYGFGCPECGKRSIKEKLSFTAEEFNAKLKEASNDRYELVGEYVNYGTETEIRHKECGYVWKITPSLIIGMIKSTPNKKCPNCTDHTKRYTKEDVNNKMYEVTGEHYEIIGEYTTVTKLHNIRHECGNIIKKRPCEILYSNRVCPCKNEKSRSRQEEQLLDYIKSIYKGDFISNSRTIIPPRELDIYLPDLKLAFEFNGMYWHSAMTNKSGTTIKDLHQFKIFECHKKGIRLVQVFDNEWKLHDNEEKAIIKDIIKRIIKDPNCIINEDLKWGIPTNISLDQVEITEPKRIELLNSRVLSEDEYDKANNYTYDCGTFKVIEKKKENKNTVIANFLLENKIPFQHNVTLNNGQKVHYYFKDKQVAIFVIDIKKYCNKNKNSKLLMKNIREKCLEVGVRPVFFYSDEIQTKPDIIFGKIRHIVNANKNLERIYARKCTIREIESKEKNIFLDKYHLQGKDQCAIKLGMFYEDELVSVMTFCKPRLALGQKNKNEDVMYELSRFASISEKLVIGGFSRLLKYFERNYEFDRLITYADLRYSDGNVYKINNWNEIKTSEASYGYVNLNLENPIREFRFKYRKQELGKLFPNTFNADLSEVENMKLNNYYQIFNLGNKVFEYIPED